MRKTKKAPPAAPPVEAGPWQPPQLRSVDKTIPELGGAVRLRDLLLSERLAFRRLITGLEAAAVTVGVSAGDLMVPQLLAITVERDGAPVMNASQWEVFGAKHNKLTLALFDEACVLCGFLPDANAKN